MWGISWYLCRVLGSPEPLLLPAAAQLAVAAAEAGEKGLHSAVPMQFFLSSADGQILPHIHNIYIKKATSLGRKCLSLPEAFIYKMAYVHLAFTFL